MQTLLQQLLKYEWSAETLTMWERSDFKCVYCGLNTLASLDNYKLGVPDHLLPQISYPQLANSLSNKVLACWVCNTLKRHWDPNTREGGVLFVSGNELTNEQRIEFIRRARRYVETARIAKSGDLVEIRRAIEDYHRRTEGIAGGG